MVSIFLIGTEVDQIFSLSQAFCWFLSCQKSNEGCLSPKWFVALQGWAWGPTPRWQQVLSGTHLDLLNPPSLELPPGRSFSCDRSPASTFLCRNTGTELRTKCFAEKVLVLANACRFLMWHLLGLFWLQRCVWRSSSFVLANPNPPYFLASHWSKYLSKTYHLD